MEKISIQFTNWVGTPQSIIAHSIFFVVIFGLRFVGLTIDQVLLILTTAVSLEAIYLAIFIQMTVNRQTQRLAEFGDEIEDIQGDLEDIQEDDKEDELHEAKVSASLEHIQTIIHELAGEIDALKKIRD